MRNAKANCETASVALYNGDAEVSYPGYAPVPFLTDGQDIKFPAVLDDGEYLVTSIELRIPSLGLIKRLTDGGFPVTLSKGKGAVIPHLWIAKQCDVPPEQALRDAACELLRKHGYEHFADELEAEY